MTAVKLQKTLDLGDWSQSVPVWTMKAAKLHLIKFCVWRAKNGKEHFGPRTFCGAAPSRAYLLKTRPLIDCASCLKFIGAQNGDVTDCLYRVKRREQVMRLFMSRSDETQQFLDEIINDPSTMTIRVFCDWLEENDPEKARHVRIIIGDEEWKGYQ